MGIPNRFLNRTVASFLALWLLSGPAWAVDESRLSKLRAQLLEAGPEDARRLAGEIALERSRSGSPAMDLLLKRGNDALEAGERQAAIEHFTALTDHAPEFAEGWYRRAVAYARAELFGPALADLERALALSPRHYDAIATLGNILAETGKPEMARRAFERVLAIHAHHPAAADALGQLQSLTGIKEI